MRVLDPGHEYLLGSLDGGEPVRLTFVKREGEGYPGNVGHHPGTTIQEVCRALIERLEYVNRQIPCEEDTEAVGHLRDVIWLLEGRAAHRHGRLWPGDVAKGDIEHYAVCPECGHIGCDQTCRPVPVGSLAIPSPTGRDISPKYLAALKEVGAAPGLIAWAEERARKHVLWHRPEMEEGLAIEVLFAADRLPGVTDFACSRCGVWSLEHGWDAQ